MLVVGKNKHFFWSREVRFMNGIAVETTYGISYAKRVIRRFLSYYVDVDGIPSGQRRTIEVPDDQFNVAIKLSSAISYYELSTLKGFREEFNKIEASDPQEFLNKVKEVVDKYVTVKILREISA